MGVKLSHRQLIDAGTGRGSLGLGGPLLVSVAYMETARVSVRCHSAPCRHHIPLFDWIAPKLGRHQTLLHYLGDTSTGESDF